VSLRHQFLTLGCAALLAVSQATAAAPSRTKPAKEPSSFGLLAAPSADAARGQSLDWLKGVGKADAATLQKFNALWQEDRPVLDKVSATIGLADPQAAKLLSEARDETSAAPQTVPAVLKDSKKPAFYRANLALAYAKELCNRRVYEEALDVLKTAKPSQVVDPAGYFFHRAVAEHALLLKSEATRSIAGVLEDVQAAPERYKMVSLLMFYDMQSWKDKDLGSIARKMDNIERRLELARGGPKTQKIQKEVVARLDELIKKLENQRKGGS